MTRRKKSFKAGRRQVERERFHIKERDPPAKQRDALCISEVIPSLMKKLGLEDQHWLTVLADEWEKLVGKAVTKHTRPGRLEGRTLIVFVDNSVWLSELARYGHREMLANLKKRFGSRRVKSLIFQLDPDEPGSQSG